MSGKPQVQDVEERTVHNLLYTKQDILTTGTTPIPANHSSTSPLHAYDYASPAVQQHTLLLQSTASNSENGFHSYSKPTTPLSNYDRTANSFDALAVPASQTNEYSTLNDVHADSVLGRSQNSLEATGSGHYSQIDDSHKYSKLSETNSKGYSQLDLCGSLSPEQLDQELPRENQIESAAQPYEVPFSPVSDQEEEQRNHSYCTVATAETGSTGYSKLHVFEGEQGNTRTVANPSTSEGPSNGISAGTAAE
jgi:hypothetical protein